MRARFERFEVVAIAMPAVGLERDAMGVVIATKSERDPVDGDPVELACVTIRLLDLQPMGPNTTVTVERGSSAQNWTSCSEIPLSTNIADT